MRRSERMRNSQERGINETVASSATTYKPNLLLKGTYTVGIRYRNSTGLSSDWAYKVFIRKIEPRTDEKIPKPELYDSAVLNPVDNAENLDEDYISDILDNMPEKQRARFRDGLWVKPDGSIYEKFEESMILKRDELPEEFDKYTKILYSEAKIIAGLPIDNPTEISKLICEVISK